MNRSLPHLARPLLLALVATAALAAPPATLAQEPALAAGPAVQQAGPGQRGPGPGQRGPIDGTQALGRFFYSPIQVLEQAEEIGLTSEQEAAVRELVEIQQTAFRQLRFDLGNEMTRLAALAVDHPVDEATIMQQLETVLGMEAEIKRMQLSMLVQVKNLLTSDQQAQLRGGGPRFGPRSDGAQRERGPRPLR